MSFSFVQFCLTLSVASNVSFEFICSCDRLQIFLLSSFFHLIVLFIFVLFLFLSASLVKRQALGPTVKLAPIAGDMVDPAQAESVIEAIIAQFGRLDILVNNAGINLPERPFEEHTLADIQYIQRVNIDGPVNATKVEEKEKR